MLNGTSSTKHNAFNADQYRSGYPDGIELNYWNSGRNHIIARKLNSFPKTPGRILDIGCGRGIVVSHLRKLGLDCWGCDLAQTVPIDNSVGNRLFVARDAFELEDEWRATVDTILLLDVIEHIREPEEFLARILEHFNNLRHMFITLPARQELWSNHA
ncbi:MAG: methyltransferase [Gemmatimonadetes bacterium]|nr:methyltransferase [Gemmatimonadota bacterium]|tara:strand:- start:135 stop:608 length:474 start_codon:yes stop_codon:yes gene_type:complete